MKIYICLMCLVTAGSGFYPGDIKMQRLGIVTTDFAGHLHQKTLVSDTNSVFSPVSAHMVMTNVVLGARGANLIEMYDVLQLTRFDGGQPKPHEAYSNLREQYSTNTTDGKVLVANGIYVNPKAPLVQKFVNNTLTYYASDLSAIDLTNPLGPEQKVNDYFKTKTEGLIQNIVKTGDIDSTSKIVPVSAFTVAAQWLKPFVSSKTRKASFYTTPKTTIQADYLYDDYRDINLKEGFHGADIAELPCRGNRYSMFFLLPQISSSLAVQEASLTAVNRSKELFKGLRSQRRVFAVPKFRIESTHELSSAFKALGMSKAFDPTQGDFTALSRSGGNYISKYFQKVILEINENGTAAVPSLAYKPPVFEFPAFQTFQLTRPFMVFMRDNKNDITLLQGQYTGK